MGSAGVGFDAAQYVRRTPGTPGTTAYCGAVSNVRFTICHCFKISSRVDQRTAYDSPVVFNAFE
jgi:hypothetical protein